MHSKIDKQKLGTVWVSKLHKLPDLKKQARQGLVEDDF